MGKHLTSRKTQEDDKVPPAKLGQPGESSAAEKTAPWECMHMKKDFHEKHPQYHTSVKERYTIYNYLKENSDLLSKSRTLTFAKTFMT